VGLKVIAEGVETAEQLRRMKEMSADARQEQPSPSPDAAAANYWPSPPDANMTGG